FFVGQTDAGRDTCRVEDEDVAVALAVRGRRRDLQAPEAHDLPLGRPVGGGVVDGISLSRQLQLEAEGDGPLSQSFVELVAEIVRRPGGRLLLADRLLAALGDKV